MTPHTILTLARSVLSDPRNWTQYRMRTCDIFGNVSRCSLGAIYEVSQTHDSTPAPMVHPAVIKAMRFLAEAMPEHQAYRTAAIAHHSRACPTGWTVSEATITASTIAMYNDSHVHADVLALFDRAIEASRPVDGVVAEPVIEPTVVPVQNGGVLHIPYQVFEFETTLELTDEFMALLNEAMTEPVVETERELVLV